MSKSSRDTTVSPFVSKMKMMMRLFSKIKITVPITRKAKETACSYRVETPN